MNKVAQIEEPDQTIAVVVEDDVVALVLFFPDTKDPAEPDEIMFLGAAGAEQLGHALVHAAMHALDASWRAHHCVESATGSACDAS